MSVERKQAGAQSATYLIRVDSIPRAVIDTDWSALPAGKLRDVMTASYPADGGATFLAAFAEAGGSVAVSSKVSFAAPEWSFAGIDNSPVLSIPNSGTPTGTDVWDLLGADAVVVRISVAYSASE